MAVILASEDIDPIFDVDVVLLVVELHVLEEVGFGLLVEGANEAWYVVPAIAGRILGYHESNVFVPDTELFELLIDEESVDGLPDVVPEFGSGEEEVLVFREGPEGQGGEEECKNQNHYFL